MAIRTVGVIGTGVIGASWTGLFLAHGLRVLVSDPAPNAASKLRTHLEGIWPTLGDVGLYQLDAQPRSIRGDKRVCRGPHSKPARADSAGTQGRPCAEMAPPSC
ncbi:hypothetical protein ARSEF4850_009390 [Beauveria asiatica]